jgi:ABC-type histidine transport system ATPase subunit
MKKNEREQFVKINPKLAKLFQSYDHFMSDPKIEELIEAREKSLAAAKKKVTQRNIH